MIKDPGIEPILTGADLGRLRSAIDGYTVDSVLDVLGRAGDAALARGDVVGAARELRRVHRDGDAGRVATCIRLFLLGAAVDEGAARRALDPLDLDAAARAGLIEPSAGSVRARLDLRPYAERPDAGSPAGGDAWWVVSDLGDDVRPGPLAAEHVLGVGAASLTLAQAVPRRPVARALDLGTGSGVQALHLSAHAVEVTATDVSRRALRFAATTAALSGREWRLLPGSLLDPVDGERFDVVVANLPFVVSGGGDAWTYRDSGLAGDAASREAVRRMPGVLAPGGSAHLLANWIVPPDGDWRSRVGSWLTGRDCDAWVWQREVVEPAEYVTLWLRDAGLSPARPQWAPRYDAWLDWFERERIPAIGMGVVSLWRRTAGQPPGEPVIVLEDVPQAYEQPAGPELTGWIARQRRLARTGDADLLTTRFAVAEGVVREQTSAAGAAGWQPSTDVLRQTRGMRWTLDVDDAVAAVVAGCASGTPLIAALTVLSAALGIGTEDVAAAALPVVRDLVGRGFLLPTDSGDAARPGDGTAQR